MDQKPKIPTLKDSQKPQVRIKGLAARLSLVERIKQFKKKDLAFILAGLGVLFMAPLAEHFMMSPENAADGTFKPGWDFMNKGGRFGDGSSPFEPGVNCMAPGSFAGSGGDVITPLNLCDPSALVIGPGATQQPPATAAAAAAPAKENTDWKDAIANAASKGASAATKAASLPVPKPALTNAGLRGLSAGSGGGGGATYSPPPINTGKPTAAQQNSLGYVSKMPGYAGVSRSPTGGSKASLDAMKKAAENAGNALNRQGSAVNAAEQAAGMNMPSGSGGGIGEGGMGKDDKGPGGNSGKDSKSLGESLAFLAAKENQQKAIDLYWKLREKEAMLWPDLKQKMLEEAVMTPFKALTAGIADTIKNFGGDKNSYSYKCDKGTYSAATTPDCGEKATGANCYAKGKIWTGPPGGQLNTLVDSGCTKVAGSEDSPAPKAENVPQNQQVDGTDPTKQGARVEGGMTGNLDKLCEDMDKAQDPAYVAVTGPLAEAYVGVMSAKNAMNGNLKSVKCGSKTSADLLKGKPNLETQLTNIDTKYLKPGYEKLNEAEQLLDENLKVLEAGDINQVKVDVTDPLESTKTPLDTVAKANDAITNTIKPAVAGWDDTMVCKGCAEKDGKVNTAAQAAKDLFGKGVAELAKTQKSIDLAIKTLADAQLKANQALGAVGAVPSGKEIKDCGGDAPTCLKKYVATVNAEISRASEKACGGQGCTAANATGGLKKTANLQMQYLNKGKEDTKPEGDIRALRLSQGNVNIGRGLQAEGNLGPNGLPKLKVEVRNALTAIPETPELTADQVKVKLGEIVTAVNTQRDVYASGHGYTGMAGDNIAADLRKFATDMVCGGKGSDACVPGGRTQKSN
ncbi:MAG: hypothetical protein PHU21_04995 [Elusimicrobia bacterium]|nr:hypothetical protein [Elusimicrobiota bacterium]